MTNSNDTIVDVQRKYIDHAVIATASLYAHDSECNVNGDAPEEFSPVSVERLEWEHIQKVLKENDGNISATARSLGMYRRTLQRKLTKKPVAE